MPPVMVWVWICEGGELKGRGRGRGRGRDTAEGVGGLEGVVLGVVTFSCSRVGCYVCVCVCGSRASVEEERKHIRTHAHTHVHTHILDASCHGV